MFSRQRKLFSTLAHIQAEVNQFPANWVLDGELYSDTLTFQEIVSIVKKESPTKAEAEKQKQIKYHVYDVILSDSSSPFKLRYVNLARRVKSMSHLEQIHLVATAMCADEDEMRKKHAEYIADGYEGIMLRNAEGVYKQAASASTRSVDLQKYKEFKDAEFEIIGFTEGTGPEEGCVIWICRHGSKTFNCRPRGTREERMALYNEGEEHVGKRLSVRYQELTDELVPRFPVGIAIRDYE
jgi:DNA ligase-1